MRLVDLDPRWLMKDGKRIGFTFLCPNPERNRKWWMTCFVSPTPHDVQCEAIEAAVGETDMWQPCNEICGWTVAGGIDAASFESMTITPSLDGGASMWHGFITSGEIAG